MDVYVCANVVHQWIIKYTRPTSTPKQETPDNYHTNNEEKEVVESEADGAEAKIGSGG